MRERHVCAVVVGGVVCRHDVGMGVDLALLARRLRDLESRLEALGAPFGRDHARGLTPTQVEELWELPGPVPDEVGVWFGWHNGIVRDRPTGAYVGSPFGQLLSLSEAFVSRAMNLSTQSRFADMDDPFLPRWLPFAGTGQAQLCFDLSDPSSTPVLKYEVVEPDSRQRAASVSEFVAFIHTLVDEGTWSYDRAVHQWTRPEPLERPDLRWLETT